MSSNIEKRTSLPKLTDRIELGEQKLEISPFCLGMVGNPDTIPAAYDAGVNFFFYTADMHWPYYESTRKGLAKLLARGKGIRDDIVVAVVSYTTQPEFCYAPIQEALEAVPGIERVDVPVVGGAYGPEFFKRSAIYQGHRQNGFLGTRAIGCTFHDRPAAVQASNHDMVDVAFIRYNPVHPGAQVDVFPHLKKERKSLLFNFKNTMGSISPEQYEQLKLDPDHWRPKVADYYRFALTRPEMDGILFSLDNPGEVDQLAAAMGEGPLDEEEQEYLMDLALLTTGKATLQTEGDGE